MLEFHRYSIYTSITSLSLSLPPLPPKSPPHLDIIADTALMCSYLYEPLASLLHLSQLKMTLANEQPVGWVESRLNCRRQKQKW